MRPEPSIEVLSAYVDQELTGVGRQELEEHLRECETCRRRLEAMRQTVQAIHTLPTEAPPRVFTIPAQRQQVRRWRPVGAWASGLAAVAIVGLIVTVALRAPHLGSAPSTTSGGTLSVANAPAAKGVASAPGVAYAPAPGAGAADRSLQSTGALTMVSQTVVGPSNTATLTLSAQPMVAANGTLTIEVTVRTSGSWITPVRLSLLRGGYGVQLPSMTPSANGTAWERVRLDQLPLATPRQGSYQLVATWDLDSATQLVATVPVELR